MFVKIREHSQRLRTNTTVESDVIFAQQKKVMITMFIVLACFMALALLPYTVYSTYVTMEKDKKHFSSYINPLVSTQHTSYTYLIQHTSNHKYPTTQLPQPLGEYTAHIIHILNTTHILAHI